MTMGLPKKSETTGVLPEPVTAALAAALAPVAPSADRAAAIKARVLDRVRGEPQRFVTVRAADGTWFPLAPGVACKMLSDDGAMQSFLLRFSPGARLPAHEHAADEHCVVLEGTVRLGDIEVGAGDYHVALAGSTHGILTSAAGALLFIRTASGAIPHR